MRILFLTHSFNSLAQKLFVELSRRGHEISVEFDISDAVTEEAVALFHPELIVAPFLKRAIPESVWCKITCFVVHPGPRGDRGPSALDWALLHGETQWGVTIIQANAEMDGGAIWAEGTFPMRLAPKSELYRNEVTEAATLAVLQAVARFTSGTYKPEPLDYESTAVKGIFQPLVRPCDRALEWSRDTTVEILRKIHSADGSPGVVDLIAGHQCTLYNASPATSTEIDKYRRGECPPGSVLGWSHSGVLRATTDGAVWIGHLRNCSDNGGLSLKLPAHQILGDALLDIPEIQGPAEIHFEQNQAVGFLYFDFRGGAMSTEQCTRLRLAILGALETDIRVLVLMGGKDFWSTGIHLHQIEAASSAADESRLNIEAMNDLARVILTATQVMTISALQGNAGAGGVFLALAADYVFARTSIILNPHYKAMGNLYGSEYWTYCLPRRVGPERARQLTGARLPVGTPEALDLGLIDAHFGENHEQFKIELLKRAQAIASDPGFSLQLKLKDQNRLADEAQKPLEAYRCEEMKQLRLNFYGFDPSYHVARYNFVYSVPHSRTPRHLAKHREPRQSFAWCTQTKKGSDLLS